MALLAAEMDDYWGVDRLRLLVPVELREKFDRQRHLYTHALWNGDLEELRAQARRMIKAWRVLDQVARDGGKTPLSAHVWEVALADGTVAAIVQNNDQARLVSAEGRCLQVYTLEEIARLIFAFPALVAAKEAFEGVKVVGAQKSVVDPQTVLAGSNAGLNDPLDDLYPEQGAIVAV